MMIMIGVIVIVMAMAMAIYDNTNDIANGNASNTEFIQFDWKFPASENQFFLVSNSFCDSLSGIYLLMMICRWNFPANKILSCSCNIHLFAPMQC